MGGFPAFNAGHFRVYHRKMRTEVVALSTDTLYIPRIRRGVEQSGSSSGS